MISVIGLTLGVAVLVVVMSVMNGFERELRSRILTVTSHATLMGLEGPLPDWRRAREVRAGHHRVSQAAVPYIESRAMVSAAQKLAGVQVRGIDPVQEASAVGLGNSLVSGTLESLQPRQSIASSWARRWPGSSRVEDGRPVVVIVPKGTVTPAGIAPQRCGVSPSPACSVPACTSTIAGLALMNIEDAAKLYRLGDAVTGVRLALDDPLQAPAMVRALAVELGGGYYVSDWTRNHANFFRSIEMTKSHAVRDPADDRRHRRVQHRRDAGHGGEGQAVGHRDPAHAGRRPAQHTGGLHAAGRRRSARPVCLLGIGAGRAGGRQPRAAGALAWSEAWARRFLDAKVYFMSDLPASVELGDVLQIGGVALLLCALATMYPAWRASRVAAGGGTAS